MTSMARVAGLAAVVAIVLLGVPAAAAAEGGDASGFIYGVVETTSGSSYEGFIRWGKEEAFWGDHFNATKEELPFEKYVPREERKSGVDVFGVRLTVSSGLENRQVVVRFGDLARIEVLRHERVELTFRNGSTLVVEDGSNDIGAEIVVRDVKAGTIELPWRKVRSVRFMQAPTGLAPYAARLYGTLTTTSGSFEGFIQWDSEECLATDRLDGDSDDGEMSLEFGRIRTIERVSRSRARVELLDSRSFELSGTNDVDSDIRGIWVEDPRVGRVKVSWDAFRTLSFKPAPSSGPAYSSFAASRPLRGKVTDVKGTTTTDRLVFDVDESESWEMLDGTADGVDYSIPFALVASIEPKGRHGSQVTLRSGVSVRLEDSHDVTEDNSGVLLVAGPETEPKYVPWDEIARIDLEP